jgi:hypothetical protein
VILAPSFGAAQAGPFDPPVDLPAGAAASLPPP